MIKLALVGDWSKARAVVDTMVANFQRAQEKAVAREALLLRGHIVKNITSGGAHAGKPFAPLSAMTLAVRKLRGFGGTKPLLVTAALRNSVAVVKLKNGTTFVGIRRGSVPGKGGKRPANIAEILEFGGSWTVTLTRKMRRFLALAARRAGLARGASTGAGGGGRVITIRIPARPYVGPVVDKFAQPDDVRKRFWKSVAEDMGYALGRPE